MSGIAQLPQQFTINGVLSTDDSVLSNMEKIAASCSCWITYDIHAGRWAVVINRAGTSIKSFNNSNIIGSIDVQGTGLTDLYNSVKVTYPRYDINDEPDWVQVDLPTADRNANEPDQPLEMELFMTNDPVQAELVGFLELKQNRVDKVITFETDYTAIDLNAGDLIDVTNASLGWTNKMFRIISMREADGDDGTINISITALEYDANVYVNDLNKYARSNNTGIISIGAIGTPTAPTITKFERDARPRTVLAATTPSGVVNGVEFWLSQSSASTGFELVGIARPQGSTTYAPGTNVSVDIDNLNAGNVWAKVRGFNGDIDGPFSAVANQSYAPTQVTNAINPNTAVTDINGNLLTIAALTTLARLLDQLYSNNQTGTNSLFSKIFELFDNVTGVDIISDIGNIATEAGNSFTTVYADGTPLSGSNNGELTFLAGGNVVITADSFTNEITIDAVGGGGGGGGNAFSNVTANGVSMVADSAADTLTITAGGNIVITANATTDTMSIDTLGYWQGSKKFVSNATPVGASNGDVWFKV